MLGRCSIWQLLRNAKRPRADAKESKSKFPLLFVLLSIYVCICKNKYWARFFWTSPGAHFFVCASAVKNPMQVHFSCFCRPIGGSFFRFKGLILNIFSYLAISVTLAFMWYLNYTNKAPLSLRTTWKNGLRALPSNSHWGLHAPEPANPCSEKMTYQPTFFLLNILPQRVINVHVHQLFNMSNINTHVDMFLKN